MDVLLTFTGFHDPYYKGLIEGEEQPGPILSLLSQRVFDYIYLFDTPKTKEISELTKETIQSSYPDSECHLICLGISDPTNYSEILEHLIPQLQTIQAEHDHAEFYIAVASGTPHMHACWIFLLAGREISAHLLNIRPPKFVTKTSPLVSQVDFPFKVDHKPQIYFQREYVEPSVDEVRREIGIIGDHETIQKSLEMCSMLAPSDSHILLLGETGTGKELFAKLIHQLSGRPSDRFVPVNCASLPENLVESILFGHKRGAFTGAVTDQTGKFDAADEGTLFLDELGELPLQTQSKLLRVLEDGKIEPLGRWKSHKVDVRVIAATNKNIQRMVAEGKFREDLYYRLNVGEVILPPLRERRSDILPIALSLLERLNKSLKKPKRFSKNALKKLEMHSWPGNVRDLENVIERSVRLCPGEILDEDNILIPSPVMRDDESSQFPEPFEGFSIEQHLTEVRKQLINRALEISNGNQTRAAKLLGITPQAVNKFIQNSA